MSSEPIEKIPCIQCGAMILPRTAEKWGGLCGPCDTRREAGQPPPNMTLEISTEQQVQVQALAKILFHGDQTALTDCANAFSDWQAFYKAHESQLDYDCGFGAPQPLELLIDVGAVHGHVFEADHSESFEEIVRGVNTLKGCSSLVIDWQTIQSHWAQLEEEDPDTPLNDCLQAIAAALAGQQMTLVLINKHSDSMPLAVVPLPGADNAVGLAACIEDGELLIVSDTEFA